MALNITKPYLRKFLFFFIVSYFHVEHYPEVRIIPLHCE